MAVWFVCGTHHAAQSTNHPVCFVQIWRLVTNFLFMGRLSVNFVVSRKNKKHCKGEQGYLSAQHVWRGVCASQPVPHRTLHLAAHPPPMHRRC